MILPASIIQRIAVIAETDSTQDAAARLAGDVVAGGGLMVVAGRQLAGRARLGRVWADTANKDGSGVGLAVTFAIDGELFDDGFLALAAGLAAQRTAEDALMTTARDDRPIGLRWPNDVVERPMRGGRKLAGVLVERRAADRLSEPTSSVRRLSELTSSDAPDAKTTAKRGPSASAGFRWDSSPSCPLSESHPNDSAPNENRAPSLALIGIGINVAQSLTDWPEPLRDQAVSLRQLGSNFNRLQVAQRLLFRLERSFTSSADRLAKAWRSRSTLVGQTCTFEHNGHRYTGRVMSIEPTSEIVLAQPIPLGSSRAAGPKEIRLPALSTSLVKG